MFTQRLANLPPGEVIEVEIHLVQPLAPTGGRYELVLPTVVAPRYIPGTPIGHAGTGTAADTHRVPDASRITPPVLPQGRRTCGDLHITVAFDPGLPVAAIRSSAHRIHESRRKSGAVVVLDEAFALLDRDFVLSWDRGEAGPQAMLLTEEVDGERFFSLTIEPPEFIAPEQSPARELVFVLDASGSMSGEPIEVAKAAMVKFLHGMRPGDAFQVVRFSDASSGLGDTLVPATAENVARAVEYIDGLVSEGGTSMTAGITTALGFPHDDNRVRFVVFLTDGFIGNESEVFALVDDLVGDKIGAARLFSIGVGSAVNRHLLDGMAQMGRGVVAYVGLGTDPTPVVDRLYAQLDRPAITDIQVDFGRTKVETIVPARIPDLLHDRPVVVFGRMHGRPQGDIIVHGMRGSEPVALRVPVHELKTASVSGIASTWARGRIGELMMQPGFLAGRAPAAKRIESKVVGLSLRHNVLTEFTAFVAIDKREHFDGHAAGTTVVQGVDLAEGLSHQATWGYVGEAPPLANGSGYGSGTGGGFGGRGARVPRVRSASAVAVSGSLDVNIIRRIVRAHHNEIRGCYNTALAKDPSVRGRLVVHFVIAANGEVAAAAIGSSEIVDAALDQCVVSKVRRWRFPTGDNHGVAEVHYPFLLEPAVVPAASKRRAGRQ